MLKRRFTPLLACPPVTVDSGLKVIQLMRQSIFDLVLMDIQMPFLDGVECTRRIRAGAEGILPANKDSHIVAVTTAIGEDPEALYRKVGMDGLIGKPVKYDHLNEFIRPLADQAESARQNHEHSFVTAGCVPATSPSPTGRHGHRISTVSVSSPMTSEDGSESQHYFEVLPPMPPMFSPTSDGKRSFFMPFGTVTSPSRTSEDAGIHSAMPPKNAEAFENQLREETRQSLRGRSQTSGGLFATVSRTKSAADTRSSVSSITSTATSDGDFPSTAASSAGDEPSVQGRWISDTLLPSLDATVASNKYKKDEAARSPDGSQMVIDGNVFEAQIARERERYFPLHLTDLDNQSAMAAPVLKAAIRRIAPTLIRPALPHRRSSPAYLELSDVELRPGDPDAELNIRPDLRGCARFHSSPAGDSIDRPKSSGDAPVHAPQAIAACLPTLRQRCLRERGPVRPQLRRALSSEMSVDANIAQAARPKLRPGPRPLPVHAASQAGSSSEAAPELSSGQSSDSYSGSPATPFTGDPIDSVEPLTSKIRYLGLGA